LLYFVPVGRIWVFMGSPYRDSIRFVVVCRFSCAASPVMHDDQHGIPIISSAALLNAT
jgi:hypothetical protein